MCIYIYTSHKFRYLFYQMKYSSKDFFQIQNPVYIYTFFTHFYFLLFFLLLVFLLDTSNTSLCLNLYEVFSGIMTS